MEEVLADIGNTIDIYVKSSEATKQRRYTSYTRICVYLNIAKPLPGSITLEYNDEDWSQTIDYEEIPFRCRKCHEHSHLFRECPLNMTHKEGNPESGKDKDGFVQPVGKRGQGGRKQPAQVRKGPSTSNKFAILQNQPANPTTPANPNVPLPCIVPQSTSQGTERPSQGKDFDLSPLDTAQDLQDLQETEDGARGARPRQGGSGAP